MTCVFGMAQQAPSRLLYYVTYVLRLSSWQRVQVIVGAGTAAGVTEAAAGHQIPDMKIGVFQVARVVLTSLAPMSQVMNLVYVHLFTRDDSLRQDAFSGFEMLRCTASH